MSPYGYKIKRTSSTTTDKKVHRKIMVDEEASLNSSSGYYDEYLKGKGTLNIAFRLNQKKR